MQFKRLQDTDIALLYTGLNVPLITRDLLERPQAFSDDIMYNIHDMISDMQPDAALLTIAIVAKQALQMLDTGPQTENALIQSCDRMIDEYGALWLDHVHGKDIDNTYLIERLAHIPEDLDELCEMMDMAMAYANENSITFLVFETLCIQAGAHSLIAEAFLDALDKKHHENIEELALETPQASYENNIIAFPGTQSEALN